MSSLRFGPALVASALALCTSCSAPVESAGASVCDLAIDHLAACADYTPRGQVTCEPEDEADAAELLSMSCEELVDPKADWSFRCSFLGRKLGLCVRVANDEEVLTDLGRADGTMLDGPFEVLVWNVYKGGEDLWDDDMRAIAKGMEIFMVQEFFLDDDSRETFGALTGTEWQLATSFFDVDDLPTGVATGALIASTDARAMRSPSGEPVLNTPKMSLTTTYDIAWDERDLMVVNVHAINFRTRGPFDDHMAAIEAEIASHDGPMILAGDFNTWSGGRQETLAAMAERLGLSEVAPGDDERGWLELDHVFARGLVVRGARFVNGRDSSDHAPIAVAFEPARD